MSCKGLSVQTVNGNSEISAYSGEIADTGKVLSDIKRLQVAFPRQSPEFFNILSERIIANGFTGERLEDAIDYVIDNFAYKELNISDVIRFDRKVKLYTYREVSDLVTAGKASFDDFKIREIEGKTFRIKKSDQL